MRHRSQPLGFFYLVYKSRCLNKDVESYVKFAPPLQLFTCQAGSAIFVVTKLGLVRFPHWHEFLLVTSKRRNYRPVPFILNKTFEDEVGYCF